MNRFLKIEKWIYIHFGISLPRWREYWENYKNELQDKLDREHIAIHILDSFNPLGE